MRKILKINGNRPANLSYGLFVLLFISVFFLGPKVDAEMKSQDPKNCNIQEGSCTLDLSGHKVTLDIHPKPVKAMNDLTFRVTLTGEPLSSLPYIDLGMPGMKMGPNRVVLKEVGEGIYEGAGVIVRCSSGRRTWRATVTFPDLGEVKFIFDVIY
jgi:hypothetical protein